MNVIQTIANEMYQRCQKIPSWTKHNFTRDLELVLQRQDRNRWRLAMRRINKTPSDVEVAIIRQAFEVPDSTEATTVEKNGQIIIEMVWETQ